MQVSARLKDQKEATVVNYEFGNSLDDMVARFGKDVVFNKALDAFVIDCQSNVRRIIKKGLENKVDGKPAPKQLSVITKEAQAWASGWKPSAVSGVRKSATEKVSDLVANMTPEQKAELIRKLTGR